MFWFPEYEKVHYMIHVNNEIRYSLSFKSLKTSIHYTVCPHFFSRRSLHTKSYLLKSQKFLKQKFLILNNAKHTYLMFLTYSFILSKRSWASGGRGEGGCIHNSIKYGLLNKCPCNIRVSGHISSQLSCQLKYLHSQLTSQTKTVKFIFKYQINNFPPKLLIWPTWAYI